MADEADLLICEGMFESAKTDRAKESRHMTIAEAVALAAQANPAELWLTHYSPSMPDPTVFAEETAPFPHTRLSEDGTATTIRFA